MGRLLLQGVSLAERLRNRRMRNRLYGGVRGQVNTKEVNTSISVHLLLDLDWCYFIAAPQFREELDRAAAERFGYSYLRLR